MDISTILLPDIQRFITNNIGKEVSQLALQKNPFPEVDWPSILNQIAAKTKAKHKLPTFFNVQNIIFPSKIAVEQTSSEITALYKSRIVSGKSMIDLSGGFGVDTYFFSKKVNHIIHCEINESLSLIAKNNFKALNQTNIIGYNGDSTVILEQLNQQFDWIYIDPSRRHESKGKVFLLKDCVPNVAENLDFYFKYSNNILIKTATLLDITAGLKELHFVKNIHVVALDNEVKELLWEIQNNYTGNITIKTINITKNEEITFDFDIISNEDYALYNLPQKYIYEPNAAIMKSGGFQAICTAFQVPKLHQNSHLYTSNELITFPGRIFKVENVFVYQKNELKKYIENQKMNVSCRNFPESVDVIKKKWKIKDGGNSYCFFTTNLNNQKIVLICTKI